MLAEKKRPEKIKKDPDCLLQEKLNRQLKYENQKKKGTVKPINKMSSREKMSATKKVEGKFYTLSPEQKDDRKRTCS